MALIAGSMHLCRPAHDLFDAVRLGAPLFLRGEKLAYWNLAKMESEVLPVWRAKELHELTRQL